MKKLFNVVFFCLLLGLSAQAQQSKIVSVGASVNIESAPGVFDGNAETFWSLSEKDLKNDQWLTFSLLQPGDVKGLLISADGISGEELKGICNVFVTYDPMNPGEPVITSVKGKDGRFTISFPPKYGAHIKLVFKGNQIIIPLKIKDIEVVPVKADHKKEGVRTNLAYMDPELPVEERVESLLAIMTPEDKMELVREGWGIPGIPHLNVPAIMKVEAIHGFSYGSGATIFPQSIGMGASWNKELTEEVAMAIADETISANAKQAWSPVLDVAQDARWGRSEETYGEDPVLVSLIGGAWIKGYQSKGLWTTPKHFGGHGAPLGGRDSHDIGLSEREMREVHLVPFRHVMRNYDCQSIMMAYSDYMGVPVAKSKELLKGILRDEWGFDGFIVSDCGAISNLTSNKHYTALDKIEAANQALAAGIATNCGDTYNDPAVIEAAKNGELNMDNLDYVCRTMLRTMFRGGLFEYNPSKALDWDKVYPGWNTPEHRRLARRAAAESIVLLKNKEKVLPLSGNLRKIAVIGPGADDLQPGDYTSKPRPGQLVSVLSGIKATVGKNTQVLYQKGCEFINDDASYDPAKAMETARSADVVVLVLGDCSSSEALTGIEQTSGENRDYASLILPGNQQKLLEAVCATGKPVVLVLQVGRPYNLSYASEHCQAILVNWLPGQEGGHATADVLFGQYNPGGRLPMTFPQDVAQLPLYYNFKTSGRRYEYVDMPFYPLYPFGYGLSYTTFEYSNLQTDILSDGSIHVQASVTNTGDVAGDEVAQLYVTDMYASVKTRVMELKDFTRLHLKPGETKMVDFTLTPYQLSLLNDQMDRVVEKGEFKIMVGGKSPSYVATDKIKDSVGFETSREGVGCTIDYPYAFHADFDIKIDGIETNLLHKKKSVFVSVKNNGNLTDTGKITYYIDGKQTGDIRHYELDPGQEKQIAFDLPDTEYKNLLFTTKYKSINRGGPESQEL